MTAPHRQLVWLKNNDSDKDVCCRGSTSTGLIKDSGQRRRLQINRDTEGNLNPWSTLCSRSNIKSGEVPTNVWRCWGMEQAERLRGTATGYHEAPFRWFWFGRTPGRTWLYIHRLMGGDFLRSLRGRQLPTFKATCCHLIKLHVRPMRWIPFVL